MKLKLWQIGGTRKAYLFSLGPKESSSRTLWIPRSAIRDVAGLAGDVGTWREVTVELADWFAKAKGLEKEGV